ncbi:MAG: DUF952 domain-containing protein [Beijerinckiaceae bacterium]|nr:DUF952 domain-containing protein [Beijerinckiaceae bacterium]
MALLFKILSRPEWGAFRQSGRFAGSAVDIRDGFIHFSYAHQLAETARRHFANQPDLVLFAVAREAVAHDLRDEVSRGGDLFPHLFAEVSFTDVLWMKPLQQDYQGFPILPAFEEA